MAMGHDVADLLAERGITVDRSTVYRWVQKFGPELTRLTEKHLRRASVDWHVDETYIRVGGKWRYLWRAIDANGQMIDFRLTARRDAKAAKAFLNKAIERVRLHRPVTICTDKAQAYRRVIREINHRYDPRFDSIRHIDRKWCNNRIESDHAAMKRPLGYRQSFRSLRTAKRPSAVSRRSGPSNAAISMTNNQVSLARSRLSAASSAPPHDLW